jgi:hypothetical protein
MDTLHITTPADLVSLIGHSLGYWPHESLVCISLQQNRMGATSGSTSPPHQTKPTATHAESVVTSVPIRRRRRPSSRSSPTPTATTTVRPPSAPLLNHSHSSLPWPGCLYRPAG